MTEERIEENLSKVPKTPKNWNDLPPEIKLKAIEFLNFKERIRLGQTSHTEKCLVDALRYDFDFVYLTGTELSLRRAKPRENYSIPTQNHEFPKFLNILNTEAFYKYGKVHINQNKSALIQAKKFNSILDFDSAIALVKNLWNKTEKISLDLEEKRISINELMDIPQIRKVPNLQLNWVNKKQVVPLIQKWIEIGKELGSKLEIDCEYDCSDELAAKFQFQKIRKQSSTIRIGNGKSVLFEFDDFWEFEIYCTVIPASE